LAPALAAMMPATGMMRFIPPPASSGRRDYLSGSTDPAGERTGVQSK